jgi:DNA mismatch endonuclease (patch repair protein)
MSKPNYGSLRPASARASQTGRTNSSGESRIEIRLRKALWAEGLRYRLRKPDLPGRPDIIFPIQQVAVFVDGDFWHGRDWPRRRSKLAGGHNSEHWITKIESNSRHDRRIDADIAAKGWTVVRVWEGEVRRELNRTVQSIQEVLQQSPARGAN